MITVLDFQGPSTLFTEWVGDCSYMHAVVVALLMTLDKYKPCGALCSIALPHISR